MKVFYNSRRKLLGQVGNQNVDAVHGLQQLEQLDGSQYLMERFGRALPAQRL